MSRSNANCCSGLTGFIVRGTVLHVLTYFVIGAASYWLVARIYWTGPEALPWLRDPEGADGFVRRWFLPAQIVRAAIQGVVLFPLKDALLNMERWGGLVIASILVFIGTISGNSGAIEECVYRTTFHFWHFLSHLPEIVLQALAYGYALLAWERRIEKKRKYVISTNAA